MPYITVQAKTVEDAYKKAKKNMIDPNKIKITKVKLESVIKTYRVYWRRKK